MKLTRQNKRYRFYRLSPWNAQMFLLVLNQFPMLRFDYQRSSLTGEGREFEEADQLLADATAENKRRLRRELRCWLRSPGRLKPAEDQLELRIERQRVDWLLRILNDVRVGSWVRLKSPSDLTAALRSSSKEAYFHVALMEMAGMFQSALLEESGS